MIAGSGRFRLGLNYWPSDLAMDWWKRFDEHQVKRESARPGSTPFGSFFFGRIFNP